MNKRRQETNGFSIGYFGGAEARAGITCHADEVEQDAVAGPLQRGSVFDGVICQNWVELLLREQRAGGG